MEDHYPRRPLQAYMQVSALLPDPSVESCCARRLAMARESRFFDDTFGGALFPNSFSWLMLCSLAAPLPRQGSGSAISTISPTCPSGIRTPPIMRFRAALSLQKAPLLPCRQCVQLAVDRSRGKLCTQPAKMPYDSGPPVRAAVNGVRWRRPTRTSASTHREESLRNFEPEGCEAHGNQP